MLIYITKYFPHIITDITEGTSGLSKALLVVQAAWLCMNCASENPRSAIRTEPRHLNNQESLTQAAGLFCDVCDDVGEVFRDEPIDVAVPMLMMGKEAREVYALLK